MTNYLDFTTNPDAEIVADLGGEIIQLALDWVYSMVKFIIDFVVANFAVIATLAVLGLVVSLGIKKFLAKGRVKTSL